MASENGDYFGSGLTLGLLVGLLAALLFAPSSGSELRARLVARFRRVVRLINPPNVGQEQS